MLNRNYDKLAAAAGQNVKEREFWLDTLAGEPVKTGFPYDVNSSGTANTACAESFDMHHISFNHTLLSKLMHLSKGSDVKLHMILTAGLAVLLEKYTHCRDILVCAPIYKQDADIEFINTVLILRSYMPIDITFKELLLQVRETITRAVEHQNYPVEILLEQLHLPYNAGKHDFPLTDIVIMHENIHHKKYLLDFPYHLLFYFQGSGHQVEGRLEYNPGRYRKSTIRQIARHYLQLMAELVFNVDTPLSRMELLNAEEKQRILFDFNSASAALPGDKTLHDRFARQVEKTPDRIALVSEELLQDFQLTYGELNRRANQLAVYLRSRGVTADVITALLVEKSLEMMVGILGILKAGGVYLPIDPAYPPGRSEYMLKESSAAYLITYGQNALRSGLTGNLAGGLEIIDIFSPDIYKTDQDAPELMENSHPGDAAYIIYTSGSTGLPKGVVVEHRNVLAYIEAFYNEFHITDEDTALQQASYSFDAFVEEVYPLLFRGGKVAICPRYVIMDTGVLQRFILKHDITFISVSPLLLNEIDRLPDTGSIRVFISGGDELKPGYVTRLIDKGSVYNTYGPTETTVCATYHKCTPGEYEFIPIGKPIANYRVHILDPGFRLVPVGVPGELCITGPGIARGYLNRPQLTAEKFLEQTSGLAPLPGSGTMYRSGDKARWFPDGTIEFLGRIDNQVKIRGFRIELGEIENQLLKHEAVTACLVQVKEINTDKTGADRDSALHRHLCAYIAVRAGKELSITGLKEYLAGHLPDYMVPSYYVLLERIPMTPNGKPDINALDSLQLIAGAEAEYVAPASDMEILISETWKELLHLDKIGIHDNFFDLGGNSVLLLKATNKIREMFKARGDIPFMVMFQYATIHSLAEYLQGLDMQAGQTNEEDEQARTIDRGKNRMKRFIKQSREVQDG